MEVKRVNYSDIEDFIMNKHYAQRRPHISYAFGLFVNGKIEGCLTIGKPASPSLCVGICGKEYSKYVYELNRLYINEGLPKNTLSRFVSMVLKTFSNQKIILVSYADTQMGHHGYIYQATNWLYTGCTKSRTDKYTPNGKHSRHYTNEFNHLRKYRSSKHRYVYVPNKSFRKEVLGKLRYPIMDYPKGDNKRYDLGFKIKTIVIDKRSGKTFYE